MHTSTTKPRMRRVASASLVGTVIEFYDFTVYGTAAALVFSKVMFPSLGASAGTAVSLATFGVAFAIRPFGSILFGHFGDRLGRKNTLVITLAMMGAATFLIGVLPTPGSIGIAAPILLVVLRCVQGLAMGGEWAGATLLATETAPEDTRGRYGTFPQLGPALGFILSSATFLIISVTMSDAAFLQWGWRLPFLASAVLIVVGLLIRAKLEEPHAFRDVQAAGKTVALPIKALLTHQWRELALASACAISCFALFYVSITYLTAYATATLGQDRSTVLIVGIAGGIFLGITTVLSGIWSDRFGRKRVLLVGNAMAMVISALLFPIIGTGTITALVVAVCLLQAIVGITYGPLGAYLPELFSAEYRYTGAGLAYNVATVLGGALTPLIADRLIPRWGATSIGIYLVALTCITLLALALSRETRKAHNESSSETGRTSLEVSR